MTNFEKWKESLTPEDLIREDIVNCREVTRLDCFNCPASAECDFAIAFKHVGDFANMKEYREAQERNVLKCPETFLAWANREESK